MLTSVASELALWAGLKCPGTVGAMVQTKLNSATWRYPLSGSVSIFLSKPMFCLVLFITYHIISPALHVTVVTLLHYPISICYVLHQSGSLQFVGYRTPCCIISLLKMTLIPPPWTVLDKFRQTDCDQIG